MRGTMTLAEVKKKLIARFGYLPDFSAMRKELREQKMPTPSHDLNEVEKDLFAILAKLEREIGKSTKPKNIGNENPNKE